MLTAPKLVSVAYVCLVGGLAVAQVSDAWWPIIVVLLVATTLPCGLVAYVVQYPVVLGFGALIDAPQEGSVPLAVVFVAIWTAAALVNLRLASWLLDRFRACRAVR